MNTIKHTRLLLANIEKSQRKIHDMGKTPAYLIMNATQYANLMIELAKGGEEFKQNIGKVPGQALPDQLITKVGPLSMVVVDGLHDELFQVSCLTSDLGPQVQNLPTG